MLAILSGILQAVIAFGLLNVWLVRANKPTEYRGGDSASIKDEFAAYGLPDWVFYLVGALKITSAVVLLIGFGLPGLIIPPTVVVLILMIGAVTMHFKIGDPIKKALPAMAMLAMSLTLLVISLT